MANSAPKVEIKVTASMSDAVAIWTEKFNKSGIARVSDAEFSADTLILDANDIGYFIGISSAEESSQMDAYRLRKLAFKSLESKLNKVSSPASRNYLASALEMLHKNSTGELSEEDIELKARQLPEGYRFSLIEDK